MTYIKKHVQNTCLRRAWSPRPSSNVRYRCVEVDMAPFNMPIIATTPPTTLYIPKSSTPKVERTTREVNKAIAMMKNILTYSNKVFLAIRLLFSEAFVIIL